MSATAIVARDPFMARPMRVAAGPFDVGAPIQILVGAGLGVVYILALGARMDQLQIITVAVTAALSLVWPASGLAMFALVMPMQEPDLLVPVRFNAILAGAILFGCFLRLPVDRLRFHLHPGLVLVIGYLVYSAVSLAPWVSGLPEAWLGPALNLLLRLSTGVALALAAMYLFRLMSPWPILALALVGAAIAALLAIAEAIGVVPLEPLVGGLFGAGDDLRVGGSFSDPNFFGLYAATAAVCAMGLIGAVPRRFKLLLVPLVLIFLVSLLFSYSRSGYLGVAVGVVVLIALRYKLIALVVAVTLALLAFTLYPVFLDARHGGELTPTESYNLTIGEDTRETMASAGIAMFAANPFFGVGFGIFPELSPQYVNVGAPDSTYSHDQYISILAEQGIVGVILVEAILVIVTIALARSRSRLRDTALAMGAAYLAVSLFLHTATVFQSSSLILLVIAATLSARRSAPGVWGER